MKTQNLILSTLACLAISAPSFAEGGPVGFLGATVALLVDVPEGIVVHTLVKGPMQTSHCLAGAFGDENGWKQNIVGHMIGIPTGAVLGVPTGALVGAKHAVSSGYDKPFSVDSFVVSGSEK